MQRKQKQAVIVIENARYWQLQQRELRELRQILARLPYECRRVYFKFLEIKKSTTQLVAQYNKYIERQDT